MHDEHEWLTLTGSDRQRGQQQALVRPDLVPAVRAAVLGRLRALQPALDRPAVVDFLQAQQRFLLTHDRPGHEESLGIAQGYGLAHDDLLAYLHANIVTDMSVARPPEDARHRSPQGEGMSMSADPASGAPPSVDGCTAWAYAAGSPAWVVKNRDYRGEHGALQHVFMHRDPAWRQRTLLCVGSLGSPGAFSSGMNSDGLAVADTQIATRDHGVGWLRYFLMTALLRECRDVPDALAFIGAVPHAGGGAIVLGDRNGRVAAVGLGHHTPAHVERSTQWVAHTNHYIDPALARDVRLPQDDPSDCSLTRLQQVQQTLARVEGPMDLAQARTLMSGHQARGGICRHPHGEGSRTLCCVVYDTAHATLHMAHGNPCDAVWSSYLLAPAQAEMPR